MTVTVRSENMREKGLKIDRWNIFCGILSVTLLLNGCSGRESVYGTEMKYGNETGTEYGDEAENLILEDQDAASEKTKEEIKAEVENKIRILSILKSDKNFRYGVQDSVGIKDEDTADMILQKLKQCDNLTISDFWEPMYSLEHLLLVPNLKSLSISIRKENGSEIEDFTPIAELAKLEELSVKYELDEEVDLSFLAEMKTITALSLEGGKIRDAAFLERMPQLERLSLYGTSIEDIAVLEKMPDLVELEIVDSADAVNVEMVGELAGLQKLTLEECGIADIGFLSSLTELRSLNLNGNFIADLSPLSGITGLEKLEAADNRIKDISSIRELSCLYELVLNGNKISDISALTDLFRLNQVDLSDNQIIDLAPLAEKEELMYLSVSGNPYTDLKPVWQVPILSYICQKVTDQEAETVKGWIKEQYPEAAEYECIDYAKGDLNKDGREDIAFVADGTFGDEDEMYGEPEPSRRLFVLINQGNGAWQELAVLPLMGEYEGGVRGDPYRGIFLGEGYLILKEGWGSGSGGTIMNTYLYQKGKLEQAREVWVEDYNYVDSYNVSVTDMKNGTWLRYIIASDKSHLVKVDLADSDHPFHKAFAAISLDICDEKPELNTIPVKALNDFCGKMATDAVKIDLPYEPWQKESYELLTGIELPDHYYVFPGTEVNEEDSGKDSEEISEEAWPGDYIYYHSLFAKDGKFYHEICYVTQDGRNFYSLNDNTGEIQE